MGIFKTISNWYSKHKIFDNKKGSVIAIVIFVALLVTLFSVKARSEELYISGGSAVVRGETPTLGFNIAWKEQGPVNTDYELGFYLIGESDYYQHNSNQIVVYGNLVDGYKKFEAGIGFAWFNNQSEYTCTETFSLLARWRFTDRFHVQAHHFSSAGTCRPNKGRDLLTFGFRF
jgi:hypothetical protein